MAFATNFKPAKGSRRLERLARKAADDKALREAYAEVDRRDGSICWVTGRHVGSSPDPKKRREHHHLKGRRVRPDWVTDPRRIITVCAEAHELLTGHFIEVEGDDASRPIFFHWSEKLMRGQVKPFAIVSKRSRAA